MQFHGVRGNRNAIKQTSEIGAKPRVIVFRRGQKVSCQASGREFRFGAGSNQGGVQGERQSAAALIQLEFAVRGMVDASFSAETDLLGTASVA